MIESDKFWVKLIKYQIFDRQTRAALCRVDSLGAVELTNELQAKYHTQLPSTLVFDYPTVAAIAARIMSGSSSDIGGAGGGAHPASMAGGLAFHGSTTPMQARLDLRLQDCISVRPSAVREMKQASNST